MRRPETSPPVRHTGGFLSAAEHADQLEMRRPEELVDGRHLFQFVAGIDENARVAREGRGIARDADDGLDAALREMGCLFAGPFARRIEDDGVGFGESPWRAGAGA